MQKIATRIFIYASIAFGIIGIAMVMTPNMPGDDNAWPSILFIKLLQAAVFIILPSFALSVASKYLKQ